MDFAESGRLRLISATRQNPSSHSPGREDGAPANAVKVSDGKYQIQWVISNFSSQPLEIHSPIFTHISVKIVLELLSIADGKMILRSQFLEFPGFHATYSIQILNRYRTFPETVRSFVFEENKRTDSVMFGSPLRHELNEANGWLTNDTLIFQISVNQPLFQKNIFDASNWTGGKKNLGSQVSFMNGEYSFQWKITAAALQEAEAVSPEFRCGEVCLTIFAIPSIGSLDFKFRTIKEAQIDLNGHIIHSDPDRSIDFEVSGFVSCSRPKIHLDLPGSMHDLTDYMRDGVMTLEFQLKAACTSPLVKDERGISRMFQLEKLPVVTERHVGSLEGEPELDFSGLCNTGETCCVNALIQAMFHIPLLRRRVYEMQGPDTGLQRLFAEMQLSHTSCSAVEFMKTLGWLDGDAFRAHRIEDFCAKLPDMLASDAAMSLITGELGDERFYKLMVPVEGCSDVRESIAAVIRDQRVVVPPILLVHLDRFSGTKRRSDRLEFSEEMEISGERYCLYGIVVHSGISEGGHYYAFLRPRMSEEWIKFNDSSIKATERHRAIDDNFGGFAEISSHTYPKSYSANMLIYVKEAMIEELFTDVEDEEVPKGLESYIHEVEKSNQRKKDLEFKRSYVASVALLTEDKIREAVMECEAVKLGLLVTTVTEMAIDTPLSVLYEKFGGDEVRLWAFSGIYRVPDKIIPNESSATLEVLVGNNPTKRVTIFAQKKLPDDALDVGPNQILLFIKFFFSGVTRPLQYVGAITVGNMAIVSDIFPKVAGLVGSDSCDMIAYKDADVAPKMLKPTDSLGSHFIDQGSFVMVEFSGDATYTYPAREVAAEYGSRDARVGDSSRIIDYSDRFEVQTISCLQEYSFQRSAIYEISSIEIPDVLIGVLRIPVALPLVELKKLIASVMSLSYDPTRDSMVLYRVDPLTGSPSTSVLERMSLPVTKKPDRIFYSLVAGTSEDEASRGVPYRVEYSSDAYTVKYVRIVYASRNPTCRVLYSLLRRSVCRGIFDDSKPVRYLMITSSNRVEMMEEEAEFRRNGCTLRVEVIPNGQRRLTRDQVLIPVKVRDLMRRTGGTVASTFLILVNKGEPFAEVKARMREVMRNDPSFNTFTFTLKTGRTSAIVPLRDTTVMNQKDLSSSFEIIVDGPGPKIFLSSTH